VAQSIDEVTSHTVEGGLTFVHVKGTVDSGGTTLTYQVGDTPYSASCVKATNTTVTSTALFGAVGAGPVVPGMFIRGTGIPANTVVTAKASTNSITISAAATDSGTDTLTFGYAAAPQIKMMTQPFKTTGVTGDVKIVYDAVTGIITLSGAGNSDVLRFTFAY
jgi:hypothetical protein